MLGIIADNDWTEATRRLAAAWHYVDALERDGNWECATRR